MQQPVSASRPLRGRQVVITRPAGTAAAFARRVRACGGQPLLLPGLSLRPLDPDLELRTRLREALQGDAILFASPAAVRFAARLVPLHASGAVFAVGQGTAQALSRHGLSAQAPLRQDSEGLLDLPALRDVRGRRVTLVGAAGGRGLLREQLAARGAILREVYVYRRQGARLDARHLAALAKLGRGSCVWWSSGEALCNLQRQLPAHAWLRLCTAHAVVSSARLAELVRAAGFAQITVGASARADDLLAATLTLDGDA